MTRKDIPYVGPIILFRAVIFFSGRYSIPKPQVTSPYKSFGVKVSAEVRLRVRLAAPPSALPHSART